MPIQRNGGLPNGHTNGHTQPLSPEPAPVSLRFSDIPSAIDIPVQGLDAEEAVEVNLEELLDDPTEVCTLLENEGATKNFWMIIALAYAKQHKVDHAIEMLTKGLGAMASSGPKEKLSMLSCLCWLYLCKSREAPRMIPEGQLVSEARTKDYYLQASTATLNEASRINPSFPPLFLARGVLYLLRASLQPPSKSIAPGSTDNADRVETLRQAVRSFEDAHRVSGGRNMMAILGRSRAQFSLGKYSDALEGYQEVLGKKPDLLDPDPRIGIGCCFWQLGFRDDAKAAWERALEKNPKSKIASILLGLSYLYSSSQVPRKDLAFLPLYKRAMTEYAQKAFRLDNRHPLTCAAFGGYFLSRRAMDPVEGLARKAIELTDVNAIASDGWYLLAQKEHYAGNVARANEFYQKSDQARGGGDRGYLPARFGMAQMQVSQQDYDGAKFRLEKIVQQTKSIEAMTLLGILYAEEVFANQSAGFKEDKSVQFKKATAMLEGVRMAWKDSKRNLKVDSSVLLNLARLYEMEHPEKSFQCLQQVEQTEIDRIPKESRPKTTEDEVADKAALREHVTPQLLNNMGCFLYQSEKFDQATMTFQIAMSACVKVGEKDVSIDTDALVTTISYNLARTYEAAGMLDEAKKVYEGLLERHSDYTDANTRLAYIALRQSPTDQGPKAIAKLYQSDNTNLEVRALYGWYLNKSKKRTSNIAEDQEQRHYKHTLQHHDKHDRYSLTGMGNLYLSTAREMRRDTDQDKEKRRKTYEKAVEFFDKALQLDPRNAYAAQGVGIALVEDKKEFGAAVQVFSKVRETVRDASVYINLGHVYSDLKQYSRAVESYETALAKDRGHDPQILACLGRVWLLKAKQEKSIMAMKNSLEYSQRALELSPQQSHFKFNIAFVQIQLAQLLYTLPESQRTLQEVQSAAEGLDEAIESLSAIAQSPNPPYPKNDIEQRANMGRNTMRKQLERTVQAQKEYEENNAAKLQQAREVREVELRKREEERRKVEEAAMQQKRKIAQERREMQERDRALAEKRAEEERKKEEAEYSVDEHGEKHKRKKRAAAGERKRKKKGGDVETETEGDGTEGGGVGGGSARKSRGKSTTTNSAAVSSDDERKPAKRRRKLERKGRAGAADGKTFKSKEIVVESESESGERMEKEINGSKGEGNNGNQRVRDNIVDGGESDAQMRDADDEQEEEEQRPDQSSVKRQRNKVSRRIEEDDDDADDDEDIHADGPGEKEAGVSLSPKERDNHVSMVDESVAKAGNESNPKPK